MEKTRVSTIPELVFRRNGEKVCFDESRIRKAVTKAMKAAGEFDERSLNSVIEEVLGCFRGQSSVSVEDIQDSVEKTLFQGGHFDSGRLFILYREQRRRIRESEPELMKIYHDLTYKDAALSDTKRENANIDSDSAMGTMLKYGSEGSRYFVDRYILPPHISTLHREGYIHIHDKDFYMLTETCCQLDLKGLFTRGFSTGHGTITSPRSITSCAALACIVLQANQNEMHGGQSIPDFDYAMETGIHHSYRKYLRECLEEIYSRYLEDSETHAADLLTSIPYICTPENHTETMEYLRKRIEDEGILGCETSRAIDRLDKRTLKKLRSETGQAMQALLHNLNTINSRCGAQVPFSSLNYGTCTTFSGRLVIQELLKATERGLGKGETPIFPVQIFKIKDGINFKEDDPNFDLLVLAMKVSSRRLFPNFSFLDADFNSKYLIPGDPDTEVAYMGCRTRVMENNYDRTRQVTKGRGNLSFTSINLPALAIESRGSTLFFFKRLEDMMDSVLEQLLHRFRIQSKKKKRNYPFLMVEGVWIDSLSLGEDDEIGDILKHGSLSIGFIGLAECLHALVGCHHGESEKALTLGVRIISFMRDYTDRKSEELNLNITLLATPAEGLSGRFTRIDRKRYGIIKGVTDKEYYTNSFHIPVGFSISIAEKIRREGLFHRLTNAGHITYVEVDGDIGRNLPAFYSIIKLMKENNIGYGSLNHPVDYDPVCGYTGVIDSICPGCGRVESDGKPFNRIRRITGYLVGTLDRFNDAKRKEVMDRVLHR